MKIFKYKRVPYAEIRAFSVHILTASGSFLAFLGVVAASEHRFVDMFWWLGLALLVDGIDGPIARKVRVKEVLPNWSGDTLDNIIDYVTYVTAHELGHQYWAHQIISADMQGGTILVETMAQYSALMVMKHLYGEDKIRRFLKFELDNYLRSRGGEVVEELPLTKRSLAMSAEVAAKAREGRFFYLVGGDGGLPGPRLRAVDFPAQASLIRSGRRGAFARESQLHVGHPPILEPDQ